MYEVHNWLREGTPANPKLDEWGATVAGSYDFGVVKVGAAYERLDYDVASGGNLRRDLWAISATSVGGSGLALDTARGAWVALYFWAFLALLALACAVPHRPVQ